MPIINEREVGLPAAKFIMPQESLGRGDGRTFFFSRTKTTSCFLPLDEAVVSEALILIGFGSDGRVETLMEPSK